MEEATLELTLKEEPASSSLALWDLGAVPVSLAEWVSVMRLY